MKFRFVILLFVAAVFCGCADGGNPGVTGGADQEAAAINRNYWQRSFNKCDGKFYAYFISKNTAPGSGQQIIEYDVLNFDSDRYTHFDSSFEWQGYGNVYGNGSRIYANNAWREKSKTEVLPNETSGIVITKQNGEWKIDNSGREFQPVPCDRIPK